MCWFSSYFRQGNGRNFCGSCGSFCENYRLGQLSGANVQAIFLERNYPGGEIIGGGGCNHPGGNCPGDNFTQGKLSGEQSSREQLSRGKFSAGAIFLGGNYHWGQLSERQSSRGQFFSAAIFRIPPPGIFWVLQILFIKKSVEYLQNERV